MSDERANIKVEPETHKLLKRSKPAGVSWSDYLRDLAPDPGMDERCPVCGRQPIAIASGYDFRVDATEIIDVCEKGNARYLHPADQSVSVNE